MKSNLTKKILAGTYKGKTLKLPSLSTTRSSKGIVLESFFNTIQFEVVDALFVEVFAGSGSIGLEALSRGAQRVFFMEKDKAAQKILRENIAQTDPNACEVIAGDSFQTLPQLIDRLDYLGAPAYIYIDPPFNIREGHEGIYDQTMALITRLPTRMVKLIIIEHMTGLELPPVLGSYTKGKHKKFGKTSLTYYSS